MFGNTGNHVCGLYYTTHNFKRTYLPQVELVSDTLINPVCFTTNLTQTFRNPNNEALLQVRYTFPLYDGVAVSGYTISYADKSLTGIVKQKDDAKQRYQAAVDRGETAGLLESLPAGVFGVTLGNVPANVDIIVAITYCGELKHDAAIDGLRYMLPISIAPRKYPGEIAQSNTIPKKGTTIKVSMDMASSAIRKVQSPSHPIAVSMGSILDQDGEPSTSGEFKPSQAAATLALGTTELGGDFILQLLIDDISKPQAIVETHPTMPNQRAIMATLVPKFTLEPAHPEIVFIADQSGSMSGAKNASLVSALKVFLKSLPLGVRFNICAFGSNFKFLWPKSQAYNESNVNAAVAFIDGFTASYGGTEILKPITAAFEQRLKDMPLEVMLLTDGEVWAEESVFGYINGQIRDEAVNARVFALGIGTDVSHTLVEGVARAGNGFAQFVTQNEDTDQKVIRMLKGALYAHTKDYELEVHYAANEKEDMTDDDDFEMVERVSECLNITDKPAASPEATEMPPKSFFDTSAQLDKSPQKPVDRYAHLPAIDTPKLLQAPNEIPPLFPFNRTTVYLLLGPEPAQKPITSVTLRAQSAQGPLSLTLPVHASDNDNDGSIHHLAARKAIQDLEEGRGWIQASKLTDGTPVKTKYESRFDELVEREVVRLGVKFRVASKWTSFVATEERSAGTGEEGEEKEPQEAFKMFAPEAKRMKKQKRSRVGHSRPKVLALADEDDPAVAQRYVVPFPAEVAACAGDAAAAPSSGLFGDRRDFSTGLRSSTNTGTGLFEGSHGQQASSGGLFGRSEHAAAAGGFGRAPIQTASNNQSAFGSTGDTGGGLLGSAPVKPQASSLFRGATTSGGSLFGGSQNTQGITGGGLFGGASVQGQSGGLFGRPPSSGPSLFGHAANRQQCDSCRLFGSNQNTTGGSLFCASKQNTTGSGLFGTCNESTTGGGLFGCSTRYGFTPKDIAANTNAQGNSFGSLRTTSAFGAPTNPFGPGGLFAGDGLFGQNGAPQPCADSNNAPRTSKIATQTSVSGTTGPSLDVKAVPCFGASTTSQASNGATTATTPGHDPHDPVSSQVRNAAKAPRSSSDLKTEKNPPRAQEDNTASEKMTFQPLPPKIPDPKGQAQSAPMHNEDTEEDSRDEEQEYHFDLGLLQQYTAFCDEALHTEFHDTQESPSQIVQRPTRHILLLQQQRMKLVSLIEEATEIQEYLEEKVARLACRIDVPGPLGKDNELQSRLLDAQTRIRILVARNHLDDRFERPELTPLSQYGTAPPCPCDYRGYVPRKPGDSTPNVSPHPGMVRFTAEDKAKMDDERLAAWKPQKWDYPDQTARFDVGPLTPLTDFQKQPKDAAEWRRLLKAQAAVEALKARYEHMYQIHEEQEAKESSPTSAQDVQSQPEGKGVSSQDLRKLEDQIEDAEDESEQERAKASDGIKNLLEHQDRCNNLAAKHRETLRKARGLPRTQPEAAYPSAPPPASRSAGQLFGSAPPPPAPAGAATSIAAFEAANVEAEESDDDDDMGYGLFDGPNTPPAKPSFAAASSLEEISVDDVQLAQYAETMKSAAEMPLADEEDFSDMEVVPSQQHKILKFAGGFSGHDADMDKDLYSSDGGDATAAAGQETVDVEKTLHALIALQTFSGAWAWNENFCRVLNVDAEKVPVTDMLGLGFWGKENGKDVCATALALAWLQVFAAERKGVWEMVAAKGEEWLRGLGKGGAWEGDKGEMRISNAVEKGKWWLEGKGRGEDEVGKVQW
ncbi:uncharacterized protein LTR77_004302 [Saxophila tyrrhenica]|uniref:von Willebrand factor type A domain-containing protein n=1 Tax=Saxophila tyrrhenica TaxID=1690608 RepID=A0AAV9PGB0_9PEZI|nr:hypothetical protein LTR77_004302 [Saxophila tyrrhenica]